MRKGDAKDVALMMKKLAAHHGDKAKAKAADFIQYGMGRQRLGGVWLALHGKRPVAFAAHYDWMNYVRRCPVRVVDLLFVAETYRGQGVGELLMRALAQDADNNGIGIVYTSAAMTNQGAARFYMRLGFEIKPSKSTNMLINTKRLARKPRKIINKNNT